MKKAYEIGEGGAEWASSRLGQAAETGETYKLEVTAAEEKALVAAGWLIPSEPKKKGDE